MRVVVTEAPPPRKGGRPVRPGGIAAGPFDHREPFAAPDGKSIVCSSDRTRNYDIWKVNLTTGEATALTSHPEQDYSPAYSPDGKAVAFASSRNEGAGIYLIEESRTEKLLAATGKGVPSARDGVKTGVGLVIRC